MSDTIEKIRPKLQRRHLVKATAERLRDLIFAREPDTQIGSLPELAHSLGVGIVTVQQAARVLEHEGLLEVRRGPGGGYYGRRPDAAALERSLAAYLRMEPSSYGELLDMTTLLFSELVAAASNCEDVELHEGLQAFGERIESCTTGKMIGDFEGEFQDHLFLMVDRPLFGLVTRVALNLYATGSNPPLFSDREGICEWRLSRHRIIGAILSRDTELARFEGTRARRDLMERLRRQQNDKSG